MNTTTILEVEQKDIISHTQLKGNEIIDGRKLNYSIAEAIMTLRTAKQFGNGEIEFFEIEHTEPGFIFEGEDGTQVFYYFTNNTLQTLYVNKEKDANAELDIMRGLVLLTAIHSPEDLKIIEQLKEILNFPFVIEKNSESASKLAKLVAYFEDQFSSEILSSDVTYKAALKKQCGDFEMDFENNLIETLQLFKGITEILPFVSADVESTITEEVTEKPITVVSTSKEETKEENVPETLFDVPAEPTEEAVAEKQKEKETPKEEAVVEKTSRKRGRPKNTEKTSTATAKKKEQTETPKTTVETAEKVETPTPVVVVSTPAVPSLEELQAQRPFFFDDSEVKEYLEMIGVEKEDIDDIVAFRKEQRNDLPQEVILDVEPGLSFFGSPDDLMDVIDCLFVDDNLVLSGNTSTGKTTLVQTISCLLNYPLYTVNSSKESNIETFLGFKTIENGAIQFVEGRLTKAARYGGIFYPDEFNMIPPQIFSIINGAADHRKEINNDFTGERIQGHKKFRIIGAMNPNYAGTQRQNEATLDRFLVKELDYMTPDQLEQLLQNINLKLNDFQINHLGMGRFSEVDIAIFVKLATALQLAVKDDRIPPHAASIRNIISLLKLTVRKRRNVKRNLQMVLSKYDKETQVELANIFVSIDQFGLSADDFLE